MDKCTHCKAELPPKPRFCRGSTCRVAHFRNASVTKQGKDVTPALHKVTEALPEEDDGYREVYVGPMEDAYPGCKCPKHGGLLSVCHC